MKTTCIGYGFESHIGMVQQAKRVVKTDLEQILRRSLSPKAREMPVERGARHTDLCGECAHGNTLSVPLFKKPLRFGNDPLPRYPLLFLIGSPQEDVQFACEQRQYLLPLACAPMKLPTHCIANTTDALVEIVVADPRP